MVVQTKVVEFKNAVVGIVRHVFLLADNPIG